MDSLEYEKFDCEFKLEPKFLTFIHDEREGARIMFLNYDRLVLITFLKNFKERITHKVKF
jgi:hypothetical protein